MARADENTITAAKLAEAYGILTKPTEDGKRHPAPTTAWYGADKHIMALLYQEKTRAGILVLAEDLRKTPHQILDRILLNNRASLEMALEPRALAEFLQRICPNDREAQWELLDKLSDRRNDIVAGVVSGKHKDEVFALLREVADERGLLPMLEELLSCRRMFQADAIMQHAAELRGVIIAVGGDKQAMFRKFTDKNITDTAEINALARDPEASIRLIKGVGGDGATIIGDLFASDATYAPDADAAKMRAVIGNVDGVLALIDTVGGDRLHTLRELIESSPATGKIYETKDRRRTLLVAENASVVAGLLRDGPYPPAEIFQNLMRLSPQDIAATIEARDLSRVYARLAQQRLGDIGGDAESVRDALGGASSGQRRAIIEHADAIRGLIAAVGGNAAVTLRRMLGASGYAPAFNDELTTRLSENALALSQLIEQTGFPQEFFPCLFEMSHPRLVQTAEKADMDFLRGIRATHAREELKDLLIGAPMPGIAPPERHPEDKPFIMEIRQAKGGFGNTQPRYEIALTARPSLATGFSDEDRHRLLNEVEKLVHQALKLPVFPGAQEGTYHYPRGGEAVTDSRKAAPLLKRIGGAEETLKLQVNPATTALLQELLVAANHAPEIPEAARARSGI